ncbi:MAG: hypothetical protein PUB08_00790 [Firmicutes bacterium]|nr:hypothetical protein [Bacillota bacterium]
MEKSYQSPFQFIGSSVKSLRIKNDFLDLPKDGAKGSLDVSHKVVSVNTKSDDKGGYTSGVIELHIVASNTVDKKKYTVDLLMDGCFAVFEQMEVNDFRKMLVVNGVTALYSIARGFIISVSSQTLMSGNVTLPMFNVSAYSKDMSDENTETGNGQQ